MKKVDCYCLCRSVHLELALPSLWAAHCHCSLCRRAHGAAFVTWVGFKKEGVRLVSGEEWLTDYASTPGAKRSFCRRCGSTLLFQGDRWPDECHVVRANIEGELDRVPSAHVFFDDRAKWIELEDGLKRFGGVSGTEPLPSPEKHH